MPLPYRIAAALLLAGPLAAPEAWSQVPGYAHTAPGDSLRPDTAAAPVRRDVRDRLHAGTAVDGFLSEQGLPPRRGRLAVTDTGLVFRSADGRLVRSYPLVVPLRSQGGRRGRAAAVDLAYVEADRALPVYFFRVDASIFGTESPGALLDVAEHPAWLDSLAPRERPTGPALTPPTDTAAILDVNRRIAASSYADTLYSLFGRPARPVGLVGPRGRKAGRLGEYIGGRDSLALDPGRITSVDQLRHAMAHELGHRWQSRAPAQLRTLWRGIAPIRDRHRYGYGSPAEQQAEAIAFAVHYLQSTASAAPDAAALDLLERYELLVPGTRIMARYLALQPAYARHPLRRLLLGGAPA